MTGFLLKKTFFDLWDNLFKIALLNIGFIASIAIPIMLPPLFSFVPVLQIAVLLIGILWVCIYLSAAALTLKAVSDYQTFDFGDFIKNLKTSWPFGLFFGVLVFLGVILFAVVIPFYAAMESLIGLFFAAIAAWTLLISVLALQFFFAVRARLDTKFSKIIKKCFLIFFDNPLFCVFALLHNIFVLLVSVLLAFLFPGPAGVLLFLDEALRLRLLKYDWLEANPAPETQGGRTGRRQIPWEAILIEEQEKTGTRSFRNFIFPWKD